MSVKILDYTVHDNGSLLGFTVASENGVVYSYKVSREELDQLIVMLSRARMAMVLTSDPVVEKRVVETLQANDVAMRSILVGNDAPGKGDNEIPF